MSSTPKHPTSMQSIEQLSIEQPLIEKRTKSTASNLQNDKPSSAQVVINTRPVERSAPLTDYLEAAGLSVIEIPMLALQSRPTTSDDIALMRQWLEGDCKALVVVSPTAAASGLAVWQALEREHQDQQSLDNNESVNGQAKTDTALADLSAPSQLIAVGEATASVLNDAQPPVPGHHVKQPSIANNEGMLAMPEIESLTAGDKVLIWRGLGGRRLLVDALQARGVHVDSIAWYERTMPINAKEQYKQWLHSFHSQKYSNKLRKKACESEHQLPVVVVSSGTAFEYWTDIVKDVETTVESLEPKITTDATDSLSLSLSDFYYVVLGERLANMVAEQQLRHCRVEDLAPETILAAIDSHT
ncbi:uroporphyrinogen-III synthase [Psychrobacter sp.]|uniref:uroporphyrinogen-III synthase n=1 Tax=Psychrobacter sp. TaxID=56811 RepID=UPI002647CC6A|nr:uroporphyrinogen-III synthase [Psychrobacter sp.]MDN6274913.1 uroporphyrinogen-III synthase [Psychrobacter sp.]MDN6307930.1 uroporphyrinogen-III synthase [Psychrobacter sp.]